MNVTQWFDAKVNPVHNGWYETRWSKLHIPTMRFWKAGAWYVVIGNVRFQRSCFGSEEGTLTAQWRGGSK